VPSCCDLQEREDVEHEVLLDEVLGFLLEEAQHRRDAHGVELAARVLVELPHDRLEGQALAVGAVARHRLDGVGHEDDARALGDAIPP
jgi:predicted metal-dependent hydrolase